MQHVFAGVEGPVEVTLAKDGDGFSLEGKASPNWPHEDDSFCAYRTEVQLWPT